MPEEMDYAFGRRAVSLGKLSQAKLEECVEVLVALERVGSRKRLWDILLGKGYMAPDAVAEVRQDLEGPAETLPDEAPLSEEQAREETAADLEVPVPAVGGFVLAHVTGKERARIHPLPMRLVTLGKDPACDIVLDEPGVAGRHAQVTCGSGRFAISDNGTERGVMVNGRRVVSHKLMPNDMVEIGSAYLLFLADYGEQAAPQPLSPALAEGRPDVRLRIVEGPAKGTAFFLGSRPLVIGRHDLANARLDDEQVSDFHVQVVSMGQRVRLVDLKSRTGTRVNGLSVTRRVVEEKDNVSIGPFTLSFAALGSVFMRATVPTDPSRKGASPQDAAAGPPTTPATEDFDYDVSLDVEVDAPSDPLIRAGIKPPPNMPQRRPPSRAYAPGQLQLICVEGPREGHSFVLRKSRTGLGRGRKNDIAWEDASLSRRHAEVRLGRTRTVLHDLGSRNGVFVNGTRITKKPLRSGDTIRIGKCLFIAEEVIPPPHAKRRR